MRVTPNEPFTAVDGHDIHDFGDDGQSHDIGHEKFDNRKWLCVKWKPSSAFCEK